MFEAVAALGMLPLFYGVGSGAVCISELLSLVATPTVYFMMLQLREVRVSRILCPRG